MHIAITRAVPETTLNALRSAMPGCRVSVNLHDRNLTRDEFFALVGSSCDGIICTLADLIDAALVAKLPADLKCIATYAVGTNNIDIAAATARGIWVANTPDVLTEATAEIAIALMLDCARRTVEGDKLTRAGRFTGWAPLFHLGHSLFGATVGIVGGGRIGTCVARTAAKGFGCKVLYSSRVRHDAIEREAGANHVALDVLLRESDFVSLHCPLTPETRHMIGATQFALMKRTAFLVNTARGPVVDEAALVDALKARRIAGAGLDVYEREPELHSGLAALDNCVLLPHIGSATVATRDTMGRMCAQAVVDAAQGKRPAYAVNDARG